MGLTLTRSRWHMLAAVLGGLLVIAAINCERETDAAETSPETILLATGAVTRTSDGSDYFYVGEGLMLYGPPNGVAVMQLSALASNGRRYKIVAVPEETRQTKRLERK